MIICKYFFISFHYIIIITCPAQLVAKELLERQIIHIQKCHCAGCSHAQFVCILTKAQEYNTNSHTGIKEGGNIKRKGLQVKVVVSCVKLSYFKILCHFTSRI